MKKLTQSLSGLVAVGILLLSASAANAQQICASRDQAVAQLKQLHHERVLGRGLVPDGKAMFELFVSKSGSWTVLVSDPQGRTCVVASGASWQQLKPFLGDPA